MFECLFSEATKFCCAHITAKSKGGMQTGRRVVRISTRLKVPGQPGKKTAGGNQTEFTMARRFHSLQMKGIENNSTSSTASWKEAKIKLFTVFLIFFVTHLKKKRKYPIRAEESNLISFKRYSSTIFPLMLYK